MNEKIVDCDIEDDRIIEMIKNKDEYLIDEEEECINIKVHKLNKN